MVETKIMDNGNLFVPKIGLRELSFLLLDNPCASTNSILLPYNTNNSQDGIMFDVIATNNITINCFECNFEDGTYDIEIYHKPGTCVGYETDSAAWSLIGSVNSVVSSGVDLPTYIPISVNYPILAGQTAAFYITGVSGFPTRYTDGSFTPGVVFDSNDDLSVTEGYGKEYPFLDSFDPRRFNGTIYYDVNPPRSANTETFLCQEICTSGGTTTISVTPPHPVWTDGYGTAVTQLNMITLGGINGLNN